MIPRWPAPPIAKSSCAMAALSKIPCPASRKPLPNRYRPRPSMADPVFKKRALGWKRAAAIAWRDLKSAPGKFGFVVLSVAIGVAALVGVRGFSESFRRTLGTEARSLMAGDLSARLFRMPPAEEQNKIASI